MDFSVHSVTNVPDSGLSQTQKQQQTHYNRLRVTTRAPPPSHPPTAGTSLRVRQTRHDHNVSQPEPPQWNSGLDRSSDRNFLDFLEMPQGGWMKRGLWTVSSPSWLLSLGFLRVRGEGGRGVLDGATGCSKPLRGGNTSTPSQRPERERGGGGERGARLNSIRLSPRSSSVIQHEFARLLVWGSH